MSCDFPQIGSMPGNITIELEVEVDEETGEITAFKGDKAGTLTILGMDLVTLKLDSLTDAKVTGNTIEFTLAVSGKFLGAISLHPYTLLEQNNSSLFCQATKLNSERVRRKLSNGFLLALFCVLLRKIITIYSPHPMGKTPLSCQQGCYAAKNTSGMQPTARKQNYPNRLNRF